jgi:hypothetical protein
LEVLAGDSIPACQPLGITCSPWRQTNVQETKATESISLLFCVQAQVPPTPVTNESPDLGVGGESLDSPGILPLDVRDIAF